MSNGVPKFTVNWKDLQAVKEKARHMAVVAEKDYSVILHPGSVEYYIIPTILEWQYRHSANVLWRTSNECKRPAPKTSQKQFLPLGATATAQLQAKRYSRKSKTRSTAACN